MQRRQEFMSWVASTGKAKSCMRLRLCNLMDLQLQHSLKVRKKKKAAWLACASDGCMLYLNKRSDGAEVRHRSGRPSERWLQPAGASVLGPAWAEIAPDGAIVTELPGGIPRAPATIQASMRKCVICSRLLGLAQTFGGHAAYQAHRKGSQHRRYMGRDVCPGKPVCQWADAERAGCSKHLSTPSLTIRLLNRHQPGSHALGATAFKECRGTSAQQC